MQKLCFRCQVLTLLSNCKCILKYSELYSSNTGLNPQGPMTTRRTSDKLLAKARKEIVCLVFSLLIQISKNK